MYEYYNPNKLQSRVGDCSIRALSKALNVDWEKAYALAVVSGFRLGDVISSDNVWGSVLRMHGFRKEVLPDYCKDCYTIRDFCKDHPVGTYVIGTGTHVVTAIDGTYYDTWDSGGETPIYYWTR